MKNQFRNDGEMPPEIAAHFPVDNQRRMGQAGVKPKSKRTVPEYAAEISVLLDIFTGLVSILIVALGLLTGAPKTLCAGLLYAAGSTVLLLVGLCFLVSGLDKLRR